MTTVIKEDPKLKWLDESKVRPYVFVRSDNRVQNPGSVHDSKWFTQAHIYHNPLFMSSVDFSNQILHLESKSFKKSGMEMPRWVFYDCALVPGFVAGYAYKTADMPVELLQVYEGVSLGEWTPVSLFIIIPCMAEGEWVAHNLCSINSMLSKEQRLYGLGFLTKAFALWYANIKTCIGMTQWKSPAVKLHSHYGSFEVLTAYTPTHSYARTLTYRCLVEASYWKNFFLKKEDLQFHDDHVGTGYQVDPNSDASLIEFQARLEAGEGPFFLDSSQIRSQELDEPLEIYRPR